MDTLNPRAVLTASGGVVVARPHAVSLARPVGSLPLRSRMRTLGVAVSSGDTTGLSVFPGGSPITDNDRTTGLPPRAAPV